MPPPLEAVYELRQRKPVSSKSGRRNGLGFVTHGKKSFRCNRRPPWFWVKSPGNGGKRILRQKTETGFRPINRQKRKGKSTSKRTTRTLTKRALKENFRLALILKRDNRNHWKEMKSVVITSAMFLGRII